MTLPRGRPRLHVDSTTATSRFCCSPYMCPRVYVPSRSSWKEGFQIQIEGAHSEFHSVDEATGYVTGVEAYAKADQDYRALGNTGQPEHISKIDWTIIQSDPNHDGEGGRKLDARANGGAVIERSSTTA